MLSAQQHFTPNAPNLGRLMSLPLKLKKSVSSLLIPRSSFFKTYFSQGCLATPEGPVAACRDLILKTQTGGSRRQNSRDTIILFWFGFCFK